MSEPQIATFYEANTGTWQYIVSDPATKEAVIIDSVLDFDSATSKVSTKAADQLLSHVKEHSLNVTRILETHAHADHLTASRYLQNTLFGVSGHRPKICIGGGISEVQKHWGAVYGVDPSAFEGSFDQTFEDGEKFEIGRLTSEILRLPGHTPDHIGYMIGSNVFIGDSIFNADVGSARCDFPGGSATQLFESMQKLLSLPAHYRLYTGHDYPPDSRESSSTGNKERAFTTVEDQRANNKHAKSGTKEEEFVKWRTERDSGLNEPKLIHQALQVNTRGGRLPSATKDGFRFLLVPIKVSEDF